jgi:O-Antigen ligase
LTALPDTRRAFLGLREVGDSTAVAVLAVLSGACVAFLVTRGHSTYAVVFALLPGVVWLLSKPIPLLIALGLSLPALMSVTGQAGGYHVAASDLILAALVVAIAIEATTTISFPALDVLRPVGLAVLPYAIFVLALLPFHLSSGEVAQTLQRYELFLIPLVVGAYAALRGVHVWVLQAYVIATTVLAILWPFDHFGLQKNPVGQLFANAILILIALPALRRFLPSLVILVPALLYTESRGAIAATAVGLAVLVSFQGFAARPFATRVVPLVLLAVAAFFLMPASLRARVTTFSPGTNTPAAYSLHIRQQLSHDARHLASEHPWVGVGVGNYQKADASSQTPSDDPHEVLLLEAAEGGWGFAVLFVVLVCGSVLALFLGRRRLPFAAAAAAVLSATAVHGLVDVYWVRGTPVLGWLLVGIALGAPTKDRVARS